MDLDVFAAGQGLRMLRHERAVGLTPIPLEFLSGQGGKPTKDIGESDHSHAFPGDAVPYAIVAMACCLLSSLVQPNARRQAPPTAGARHERTLLVVACTPLFGPTDDRGPWTSCLPSVIPGGQAARPPEQTGPSLPIGH